LNSRDIDADADVDSDDDEKSGCSRVSELSFSLSEQLMFYLAPPGLQKDKKVRQGSALWEKKRGGGGGELGEEMLTDREIEA
jgi:hypothetical protein